MTGDHPTKWGRRSRTERFAAIAVVGNPSGLPGYRISPWTCSVLSTERQRRRLLTGNRVETSEHRFLDSTLNGKLLRTMLGWENPPSDCTCMVSGWDLDAGLAWLESLRFEGAGGFPHRHYLHLLFYRPTNQYLFLYILQQHLDKTGQLI